MQHCTASLIASLDCFPGIAEVARAWIGGRPIYLLLPQRGPGLRRCPESGGLPQLCPCSRIGMPVLFSRDKPRNDDAEDSPSIHWYDGQRERKNGLGCRNLGPMRSKTGCSACRDTDF